MSFTWRSRSCNRVFRLWRSSARQEYYDNQHIEHTRRATYDLKQLEETCPKWLDHSRHTSWSFSNVFRGFLLSYLEPTITHKSLICTRVKINADGSLMTIGQILVNSNKQLEPLPLKNSFVVFPLSTLFALFVQTFRGVSLQTQKQFAHTNENEAILTKPSASIV